MKDVADRLARLEIPREVIAEILRSVPPCATGLILYGSQARGDAHALSDIDLLAVRHAPAPTRAVGRVNISTYEMAQLVSASGTIFGMHLARDGVVLHDAGGVTALLATVGTVDIDRLEQRVGRLAALLELPRSEVRRHLPGFVRHARYVLRTATYARALREGNPCFSVDELANRYQDPELRQLLSSHAPVQGPPSEAVFDRLLSRVRAAVAPVDLDGYRSIADVIVGEQVTSPDLVDAAQLILSRDATGPYALIPRILL